MTSVRQITVALGMHQHPEGGWYIETWRATAYVGARPTGSAILFLLAADGGELRRRDRDGRDRSTRWRRSSRPIVA